MREIKFRAWDKEDKRMITDTQDFIPLVVTNKGVLKLSPLHEENLYSIMPIDRFELMQSTGLKDKNGVEIYDVDIVDCPEHECCGYISWNESEAGFYFNVLLENGNYEEENLYDYVDSLKVIGNIYENPDLLEATT